MRTLSMIAAMASGAAHELNNPLSVISGRAQMELSRSGDGQLRESLQSIVEQTSRATGIVNELMEFAKPNPPKPVELCLADFLEMRRQHCEAALGLLPEQLTVSVADAEVRIYADPIHVRDVLDALVTNAVEASAADSVHVKINSPSRRSDETVRIVVEDNGSGMSGDVLAHAMDPFFSHRPAGRGRGLGLSRAYRLVEINNGRLRIDSAPGQGTKVTLELPAHA
jgi:signal transduction histidine kinase